MQKWHGEKGTSSGMFRPKEIVDCERLAVTGIRTTQKGWMFRKRRQVDPEGSTGVKVPNTRRHWRLKNEKTAGQIFEKTFRLQVTK
jgi:hypothetical protein